MYIRQYPIVAKFGITHLIAANISIWILSTMSEIGNEVKDSSYTLEETIPIQTNITYKYYVSNSEGT